MPGLDGLEVTRRVRPAGNSSRQLPVVALTANAFAEDIEQCLDAGMQGHLAKPVRLGDLRSTVEAHLSHHDEVVELRVAN